MAKKRKVNYGRRQNLHFLSRSLRTAQQIKDHLDSVVIGQDLAKRKLSVAVASHYARLAESSEAIIDPDLADVTIEKSNILLIGPTGCGKTYLAKAIAASLAVPFAAAEATSLTESGYVGQDVETVLSDLIMAANGDIDAAQDGIIYIDEIDKLRRTSENPSTTRDVGGEGVQQALLKMLEGSVCRVPHGGRLHPEDAGTTIDTTNILFICAGAFVGLEDIVAKRLPKRKDGNLLGEVMPHDLMKYGVIPELIGRLPIIAAVDALTIEDMKAILTEPKNAILKQYRKLCQYQGFDLEFKPDAVQAIAAEAMKLQTGARGLRSVVERVLLNIQFDAQPGRRYVVDKDVVTGKKQPQVLKMAG